MTRNKYVMMYTCYNTFNEALTKKEWYESDCIIEAVKQDDVTALKKCKKYPDWNKDLVFDYIELLKKCIEYDAIDCSFFVLKSIRVDSDSINKLINYIAVKASDNNVKSIASYFTTSNYGTNLLSRLIISNRIDLALELSNTYNFNQFTIFSSVLNNLYNVLNTQPKNKSNANLRKRLTSIIARAINTGFTNHRVKLGMLFFTGILDHKSIDVLKHFIKELGQCDLTSVQESDLVKYALNNYKNDITIMEYAMRVWGYCQGETGLDDVYRDLMEF